MLTIGISTSHAQSTQTVETQVGNAGDGGSGGGGGTGNDNLGPGEFIIPVNCNITYSTTTHVGHTPFGLDINRPGEIDKGNPVFASADGVVWDDKYKFSDGQIVIQHEGSWYTVYAHMQNVIVRRGQRVNAGQKIGEINNKGNSFGSHLHVGHSRGNPYYGWPSFSVTNYKQVCYKRYGCNPVSLRYNPIDRVGPLLNRGCP